MISEAFKISSKGGLYLNQNRKTDIAWKIVRRCIGFILIMFLLSIVVFYFARLAPGDPLESFYGDRVETMTPAELEAARARLGLDGPIWMQYIHWLSGVFQGDFSVSGPYTGVFRPVPAGHPADAPAGGHEYALWPAVHLHRAGAVPYRCQRGLHARGGSRKV